MIITSGDSQNKITLSDIDKMDGVEFELFLKKLFQNMSYSVDLTPTTNDMGADLILSKSGERISVQAKNWSANVGNSAIQEVVGSLKYYQTQRGIVISSSDFSNQAITLAHHNRIELWNRNKLNEMITKYPVSK
jgi:HJR/Mrr/RecB family endonuclease